MIDEIRRAVTREDGQGRSEWAVRGVVRPETTELDPGARYWLVWGTNDGVPRIEGDAGAVLKPFFPGVGGTRFVVVSFPPPGGAASPASSTPAELEALRADADEKFPGLFEAHDRDPGDDGFHTTETIDYAFVVEGSLVLELDDGRVESLSPGSCVVQRGTRHAWRNVGTGTALVVFVIVGASRAS